MDYDNALFFFTAGQFYIVGASDVIGASQRTIAPRGNMHTRDPINTRGSSVNHEPVIVLKINIKISY